MTLQDFKKQALTRLNSSPSPQLDVDVLLQWALNLDRTHLLLSRDKELSPDQMERLEKALNQRATGFPIAYITGKKEFFGYDFFVNPSVLIPKPDTELLVEQALDVMEDKQRAHPHQILQVLDMCSGSGCVGISLFKSFVEEREICSKDTVPRFHFADISSKALEITGKNAENLIDARYQSRFSFVQTNLFQQINFKYDVIVTNPPYVPAQEARDLLKDGRSEPLLALDGDVNEWGESSGSNDGLALIRRLIPQAVDHLNPQGFLLMETGEYNAEETAELFKEAGLKNVRIERDLSGQMRDVIGNC